MAETRKPREAEALRQWLEERHRIALSDELAQRMAASGGRAADHLARSWRGGCFDGEPSDFTIALIGNRGMDIGAPDT